MYMRIVNPRKQSGAITTGINAQNQYHISCSIILIFPITNNKSSSPKRKRAFNKTLRLKFFYIHI